MIEVRDNLLVGALREFLQRRGISAPGFFGVDVAERGPVGLLGVEERFMADVLD